MLTLTHLTAGALAVGGILQTTNPVLLSIGAIAALLPDIDLSVSPAGRVFFFISWWLEKKFPHRGPTHSIFIAAVLSAVFYGLCLWRGINPQISIAFGLGYLLGGVFPDCITKSGAQLFWPLDNHPWWVPDNHRFRLSTGSRGEYIFLAILVSVTVFLFSVNNKGGLELEFGKVLGTTTGVEAVYNKYGSDNLIVVTVDGVRSDNRTPVKEDFTLIQAAGRGFLVKNDQGIYKAGDEPDVQIISSRITAKPGRKATTVMQNLTVTDNAIGNSIVQIYQAYPKAEIYLSGSIVLEDFEEFNPVTQPGQFPTIKKYANVAELNACPIRLAYQQLAQQWGTGQLNARIIIFKEGV